MDIEYCSNDLDDLIIEEEEAEAAARFLVANSPALVALSDDDEVGEKSFCVAVELLCRPQYEKVATAGGNDGPRPDEVEGGVVGGRAAAGK